RTLSTRYFPQLKSLSLTIPKTFASAALLLIKRHASSLTWLHVADSPGGPFPRLIYDFFLEPFPKLRTLRIGWRPFEPLAISMHAKNFPMLTSCGMSFLNTELEHYTTGLMRIPELLTDLEIWLRDATVPGIELFPCLTSLRLVFLYHYFPAYLDRALLF